MRTHSAEHIYLKYIHDFLQQLESVDHTKTLALAEDYIVQIKHASSDDPVLQVPCETVRGSWPDTKSEVPECIRAYFDFRNELTVQDHLVFKGELLIVPANMRSEMMAVAHAAHIGIEGCIRRAQESIYWPHMASELKDYISKCDTCLAHRASPGKEPLL